MLEHQNVIYAVHVYYSCYPADMSSGGAAFPLPIKAARGLRGEKFSHTIFTIDAIGMDKIAPMTPHIIPQIRKEIIWLCTSLN